MEKIIGVEDFLLQKKNLVVARRQLQRKLEVERGSQVAKFRSSTLGSLAIALNRFGFTSIARSLYKRALYPAGTVGRVEG